MTTRLLVFGATGATGSHLVRLALADGLIVRVFVRSPEKLPAEARNHPRIEVVQGDLTDLSAIDRAIEGVDIVVSTAGNTVASRDRMMTAFVKQAVASMRQHGVKRLVYQAGAFSVMPGESLPWLLWALRPTLGRAVGLTAMLADNDDVMAWLVGNAQDIDWTVTRPGQIQEGPTKGTLKPTRTPATGAVTFADLASFNLAVARSGDHLRQAPYANY